MKKLLTLLLVVAMVLGIVSSAMAATTPTPSTVAGAKFSDIAGNDAEAAITLLAVRNIIKGDAGTTTARPNDPISRAEYAAMVVRMLGKEGLANSLASMKPTTKDEIPSWAWGYVNVAQSMGIMKGDPDGSFRPSDNVTFAEALAMLERAIGQDKKVVGIWPTNVLLVAYDLGLDDGVEVFANTPATRGEVATMMVNTMNTDKFLGWDENGDENTGAAILASVTVEGVVTSVAASTNDITINYDSDDDDAIEANAHELATSVSLVGAKAFADLLNVNVKAIMNADDEIVYIEVIDDANVIVGTFDKWDENDDDEAVIVVDGKEYVVNTDDVSVKLNTEAIAYDDANSGDVDTDLIVEDDSVVLNLVDDEVVFIDATRVNDKNALVSDEATYDEDTELYTLTTNLDTYTMDADTPVTIDGAAKKVSDIEKNDVVYITTAYDDGVGFDADSVLKIAAYRATVKGEVTRVRVAADGTVTVTIKLADGTTKAIALSVINRQPAIGSTVEYRLNAAGKARYEVQVTAATSVVYATEKYTESTGTTHYYVVLDVAGVSQTFEVDDQATYDTILVDGEAVLGQYTLTNGVLTAWNEENLAALEEYEVVSVDATEGVVVLLGDADDDGDADDYVAYGTTNKGLAVYQLTDDAAGVDSDEYEYAGVKALAAGDTVYATDGVLYLIVIPE